MDTREFYMNKTYKQAEGTALSVLESLIKYLTKNPTIGSKSRALNLINRVWVLEFMSKETLNEKETKI